MKAKEKAEDLVDKFYQTTPNEYFVNEPIGIKGRYKSWEQAKQCALIAVDEAMKDYESISMFYCSKKKRLPKVFWDEVKQEIENL
jgi:hypothetical protein